MAEAQRLELSVLLETPSIKALHARQPDKAAEQAVQEAYRWPKERWRQVRAPYFLLPAIKRSIVGRCTLAPLLLLLWI